MGLTKDHGTGEARHLPEPEPEVVNTRMPNRVKMTPLDSLLVHIFSLACFQRKSSRHFSSFVGPYTVLEWREFLSALKTIF